MPLLSRHRTIRPQTTLPGCRTLILVALVVMLVSACQVQVVVDTTIDQNGAGTVRVSVGLDEGARARLGDPQTEVQVEDLREGGWEVTDPDVGADGITWIRATKGFSSPEQLDAVLAEIAGPDALFRDIEFARVETDDDITYRLTGEVDLTAGVTAFSDPDLAAQFDGDPFGGNLAAIEAEEGRPVSEMVTFEINTTVAGGNRATLRPTLADPAPLPLEVATVEVKPPSPLIRIAVGAAIAIGVVVIAAALIGVRRRVGDEA